MTDLQEVKMKEESPRSEIKSGLIISLVPLVNSTKFQLIPKLSRFLGLFVAENLFLMIHVIGTGQEVTVGCSITCFYCCSD